MKNNYQNLQNQLPETDKSEYSPISVGRSQFEELQRQLAHTQFNLELKDIAKLSGVPKEVFDKYLAKKPNTELRISQSAFNSKPVITSKYWPHQVTEVRELIHLVLDRDKPLCIREYHKIETELFPRRNWCLELQEFRVKVLIGHSLGAGHFVRYYDKTLKGTKRLRTLAERVLHLSNSEYEAWYNMQSEINQDCD